MKNVILIGLLSSLILAGCSSESETLPEPQLTDVGSNGVRGDVFLNKEYLKDASARFEEIPGSDSVRMILSGVSPVEEIEMNVGVFREENGDIKFAGQQFVEDVRYLDVSGFYRPKESPAGMAGNSTMLQIRVNYSALGSLIGNTCSIPFAEDSGFLYHRIPGTYPLAKPEASIREDSCKFICEKINSELARHIESISFSFGLDGLMTFRCDRPGHDKTSQAFRYWITDSRDSENIIVVVENASLFYKTLLDALIPAENRLGGTLPYYPELQTATLLVHKYQYAQPLLEVAVVDEMHSEIFPYLYNALLTDRAWTDTERDCFNAMATRAGELQPDNPFYAICSWTFVGGKQE